MAKNETLKSNSSLRNETDYDSGSEFDLFDDYVSDDNVTEINETLEDGGNASSYLTQDGYFCHEKYEVIIPILDSVHFWIEGVTLTTIALFGLLGNMFFLIIKKY